jgi:hypothetical protein
MTALMSEIFTAVGLILRTCTVPGYSAFSNAIHSGVTTAKVILQFVDERSSMSLGRSICARRGWHTTL